MRSYSMHLALVGALIGVLAVSAAFFSSLSPPKATAEPTGTEAPFREPAGDRQALGGDPGAAGAAETQPEQAEAVPVFAAWDSGDETVARSTEAAGPFYVALRVEAAIRDRIYLADADGAPLEEIAADREGDAALGPVAPGDYTLVVGRQVLGSFRLLENAALAEAAGRVWTDGELLHLTDYEAGTAVLDLALPEPGYYSLRMVDEVGRSRSRDLFIPSSALPEEGKTYLRTLEIPGLRPGSYALVHGKALLAHLVIRAGAVTRAAVELEP